jgi:hypothetical protein
MTSTVSAPEARPAPQESQVDPDALIEEARHRQRRRRRRGAGAVVLLAGAATIAAAGLRDPEAARATSCVYPADRS